MSNRIKDSYNEDEWENLIADARTGAETDWESNFISDLVDRCEEYGMSTFLSPKQEKILRRIAGWD